MTLKFFKNINDATKDFTKQRVCIFNDLSKDVTKSAAFCNAFKHLSDKFIKTAKARVFPDLSANDNWGYAINYECGTITLYLLQHSENNKITENFALLSVESDLISADEYAKMYNIAPHTVNQWIRRGKIRTAKKIGNDWMIPTLTESPKRGYESATYILPNSIATITNAYPFLQNMQSVTIEQDKNNKNEFIVNCFTNNMETPDIIKRLDKKAKETFEMALITHPSVKYLQK